MKDITPRKQESWEVRFARCLATWALYERLHTKKIPESSGLLQKHYDTEKPENESVDAKGDGRRASSSTAETSEVDAMVNLEQLSAHVGTEAPTVQDETLGDLHPFTANSGDRHD